MCFPILGKTLNECLTSVLDQSFSPSRDSFVPFHEDMEAAYISTHPLSPEAI